ncbi:MAG TPA: EAL domain-containing protein [Methylophilaceae bacterium]
MKPTPKSHILKLSPLKITLAYVLLCSIWILSSNSLSTIFSSSPQSDKHAFSLASIVLMMLISASILYFFARSLFKKVHKTKTQSVVYKRKIDSQIFYLLGILFFLLLLIPIINYSVIHFYTPKIKSTTFNNLSEIAKVQSERLNRWLTYRTGDAEIIASDEDFAVAIQQFSAPQSRQQGELAKKKILHRFDAIINAYGAQGIALLSASGEIILGSGNIETLEVPHTLLDTSARTRHAVRSDIYLNPNQHLQIDTVAPIQSLNNTKIIAFVLIRNDIYASLLKNISVSDESNVSTTTLLVKAPTVDKILINTGLAHSGMGEILTRNLSQGSVYLESGVQKSGTDYQGKLVYGVEHVLDSEWKLFVQIEQQEVLTSLKTLLLWISGIALLAIGFIALALLSLWHQLIRSHQLALKAESTERDRLLKKFYDMPFVGMAVCSPNNKQWLSVNGMFCHILGYSEDELLKRTWSDISSADAPEIDHLLSSALHPEFDHPIQQETKLVRKNGEIVIARVEINVVKNAQQKTERILLAIEDITERTKAAEALKRQEEFNRALLENLSDAVIACDANMELVLFNQVARDWLNTETTDIPASAWATQFGLYNEAGNSLLKPEEIPLVKAFNGERPRNTHLSIQRNNRTRIISSSAAPFFDAQGNKIGAVSIMRDITDVISHEQALQDREELYRQMFDANPNPMFVYDVQTLALLATNDAAITHYGWSRKELSQMSVEDIEVKQQFSPDEADIFSTTFLPIQRQHKKKDGIVIDVECSSNPVSFGSKEARLLLVNDVTERRINESEIRATNRLLLMLTNINQTIVRRLSTIEMFQEACTVAVRDGEFSFSWIGLLTPNGRDIKTMASAGEHQSYLDRFNINVLDTTHQGPTVTALRTGKHCICHNIAEVDPAYAWRQAALDQGFKSLVSLPLIVNEHVVGNFNLYSEHLGVFNPREMKLLEELAQDISFALSVAEVETERAMAESALRASETLFHTLARSSPVGVFHTNLAGHFLYINQSWFEITGISFEDSMQDGWLKGVHRKDRRGIEKAWRHAIEASQAFSHEYRFVRADKSIAWVKGQAAPEFDDDGMLIGFVGTVTDITAIKINEENHRMSNAVFQNTREGIMVTDMHNKIVTVNRAFTEITQYQDVEAIGMSPSILASGRHDRDFYTAMWASLRLTGHWQGELWNRRKNGDVYPELLSISAVKDESGIVINYVGVFADISNIKASEEKLEYLAHHDALTHLPNRLMLLSRIDHAISASKREGSKIALLMLDLDRFKNVNDNFGHLAGDELLKLVAAKLNSKVRNVDTVSRLGGDEFTILLENIASPEDASRVANNIIQSLEEPWFLSDSIEVRIGCSIGICLYPGHGETALELLQHADAALYQAKAAGKGCSRFFSEKLTQAARNRFNTETRLRLAIENQELRVFYQPKQDIKTGKIIGAEALVRWIDPHKGIILPSAFIGVAEDTGLIRTIGEWVLREACQQGKKWLDAGLPALKIAVNLSAHQLHHTDIVKTLTDVLEETQFPPLLLELELTESILMQRETEIIETLQRIGHMGISLAIDDFGTGYSSLSYLKSFPLDVLKIDKSFVSDLEKDEDDRAITATIIKIAHTLGLQVVAEGVETQEQLLFLKQHECDTYQGYLLSEAIPAEQFIDFLNTTPTQTRTPRLSSK